MREAYSVPAIISDANILIDFFETDRGIISLVSRHIAPLYVPDIVAEEVSQLKTIDPAYIGLTIIETPYTVLAEATNRPSTISIQDFVCMRIAEERGWGCATNDKALRRECGKRGVSVLWGLEMMLYLVKNGALKPKKAKDTAWAINRCNKRITEKVVDTFIDQIDEF
jgi:rRNA-processing protein FCF1